MPALMLLFLAVVQFAIWAHAAAVVHLAASEGDRVARSEQGGSAAGIAEARALVDEPASGVDHADVDARTTTGDVVEVSVRGSAVAILPGLSLPVAAAQSGPLQEFRESG